MDPKLRRLGWTIEVPSVRELVAKGPIAKLPPRYVRADQYCQVLPHTDSLPQVPVINFHNLVCGDDDELNSELEKLHYACKEWGFFQLINHGVSSSLVEKVKFENGEFFKLPMEEKKKLGQEPGDVEGYGQAFVVSEEQKLDWADRFYMITLPTHLRKPHLFPKLPLSFRNISFFPKCRDTLEAYSMELKKLAMKLLSLMAKALKMKDEEMRDVFEEGMQAMRMSYYPPCPQPDLAIGLSPHSDGTGLTIVLQGNEMEGLQIKKDGMWIPITTLPGAFVVNIGDMLEIVTNGTYRSVEHRVTVNSEKERLSVATFLSGKLDGDLGSAPSLLTPQTPPLFRRVSVADFYRMYYSRELRGKSHMDALRIQSEEGLDN